MVLASGPVGCGSSDAPRPDGGPALDADAGAGEDSRSLELLGEESLELAFGQTAELSFAYHEADGAPAADAVSFAIEGRAGDSSLSEVLVAPDADGRVTTTLRAGTIGAASFRVRASAPGAANAYVEVSVGDAGFGSLSVDAEYRGSREVWGVELRLYTAQACGELDPRVAPVADRSVHVGGPHADAPWSGVFASLAVGPTYTVLAMGLGKGGGIVASGCVPGVTVLADPAPPVEVAVTLEDQPYGASGRFALASRLDLAEAMSGRVDAWLAPADELLAAGTAPFLLDEVAGYLTQNVPEDASGAFAELRPELERGLAERLAARGIDPSAALAALAEDLGGSMASPTLHSELLLDEVVRAEDQGTALRFSHEVIGFEVSLVVQGAVLGAREITFAQAGLVSLSSGAATTTTEELSLARHTLPFRIGTIGAAVLRDQILVERGASSLEDYLADALDCADLGAWLGEQAPGSCDSACYEAACEQAALDLAGVVDQSLRDGDQDYGSLTLEGHARLADANGDAATDGLDAGVWTATLQGDLQSDVPADFEGERDDIE